MNQSTIPRDVDAKKKAKMSSLSIDSSITRVPSVARVPNNAEHSHGNGGTDGDGSNAAIKEKTAKLELASVGEMHDPNESSPPGGGTGGYHPATVADTGVHHIRLAERHPSVQKCPQNVKNHRQHDLTKKKKDLRVSLGSPVSRLPVSAPSAATPTENGTPPSVRPGAIAVTDGQARPLQKLQLTLQTPSHLPTLEIRQGTDDDDENENEEGNGFADYQNATVHSMNDLGTKKKSQKSCLCRHRFLLMGVFLLILVGAGGVAFLLTGGDDDNVGSDLPPSLPPSTFSEPTVSPTSLVVSNTVSLLKGKSLNPNAMDDTFTPEAKAALWIANDPNIEELTEDRLVVRYALAVLYYSTRGEGWKLGNNWLDHGVHECDWTQLYSVACRGDVFSFMNLDDSGLIGTLPPDVGLLTNMEALSLASNQIGGTIPTEMGLLTKLMGIVMSNNALTGTIPTTIADSRSLIHLQFDHNMLTGALPSELGTMAQLTLLDFAQNLLSSTIPTEIGSLVNLVEFTAYFNDGLTGTVITELGNLQKLKYIRLSDTNLSGSLPTEIGLMTSMLDLDLRNAEVEGTIPSEIGLLTNMVYLQLSLNFLLSGSIPTVMGQLTNMLDLNAEECTLESTIPSEIGLMSQLTSLKLNGNRLTGTIPEEILLLPNLQVFVHDGNFLEA